MLELKRLLLRVTRAALSFILGFEKLLLRVTQTLSTVVGAAGRDAVAEAVASDDIVAVEVV